LNRAVTRRRFKKRFLEEKFEDLKEN